MSVGPFMVLQCISSECSTFTSELNNMTREVYQECTKIGMSRKLSQFKLSVHSHVVLAFGVCFGKWPVLW